MAEIDPDGLMEEALTGVLTEFIGMMPLHATLVIHQDPVLTEDTILWSVPLCKVVNNDGTVETVAPDDD